MFTLAKVIWTHPKILWSLFDFVGIAAFAIPGTVIKWIFDLHKVQNKDTDPIVILIHGTGISSWQWGVTEIYLWWNNILSACVDYNHSQKIVTSTNDVRDQVELIMKKEENRNRPIIFVGHSQGGLHARMMRSDPKVKQVYLLNTPQRGATAAGTRNKYQLRSNKKPSYSSLDMAPGSEYMEYYRWKCSNELKHAMESDLYLVSGRNDFIDEESELFFPYPEKKDKSNQIYRSWFGHYFSAVNPFLWLRWIIPRIKNAPDGS